MNALAPDSREVMSIAEAAASAVSAPDARARGSGPLKVTSSDLLGQGSEMIIVHAGREYKLRITQNGKLILTA